MLAKRIIPCLDIRDGRVVKGKNFEGLRDVEEPSTLASYYSECGADELVFYDITASFEQRKLFSDILERVAQKIFIPLTVGGGIESTDDFSRVLCAGADKVSVNSGAIKQPDLIEKAAAKFGSQCVVLSMDVKRENGIYTVYSHGGRISTGIDAIEWAVQGEAMGAGELVVNSIDTDGVKNGFDIEMLSAISEKVSIPVIASGGAGSISDFTALFKTLPKVDAGLAASVFHYKTVLIPELKRELQKSGVTVRI